jgi:hypothetical protein
MYLKNNLFFVGILKATGTDKQSRIRIPKSVVRIHSSGSVPKCHRIHNHCLMKLMDLRYPSCLLFFKFIRYFLAKQMLSCFTGKLYSNVVKSTLNLPSEQTVCNTSPTGHITRFSVRETATGSGGKIQILG